MRGPVRVLGVDPGSRKLGWGVVERTGSQVRHVASGTLQATGADFVGRMCRIVAGLEDVLGRYAPGAAAIETAFAGKNVHSALVLGQARGAVLVALGRASLPVVEYTPGQIKLATTGHGQADKLQVQAMVRRLLALFDAPLGLDASDALACALCHAQASPWQQARRAVPHPPQQPPRRGPRPQVIP